MKLSADYWIKYINTHTSANKAAERRMERYIAVHGTDDMDKLADYAYALVSKYGEAASALSCEMYDKTARAQHVNVPDAVPAETASYGEVASAVRGAGKRSPSLIPDAVGRLVKQAGADTTLQNAKRDGAYFAWIAHGDTCPYCMALAGLGWQKAGKLTLEGGHAEHIHANCDCEYAVDHNGNLEIEGYDSDEINQQLLDLTDGEYDAEDLIRMSGHNGKGRDHGALNIVRRKQYAANPEKYRAQSRALYRRTHNTGAFEELEEPMMLKHVKSVANDMDLDMGQAKFKIDRSEELIGTGYYGATSDDGKTVILFPDSFTSRETLVKTIGHENIHLQQIREHGKVSTVEQLYQYEREARDSEERWWNEYVKKTGYRQK